MKTIINFLLNTEKGRAMICHLIIAIIERLKKRYVNTIGIDFSVAFLDHTKEEIKKGIIKFEVTDNEIKLS
jgi:hypothetical protein